MQQQLSLCSGFQTYINESLSGKRRCPSGKRISRGTIEQYKAVLYYLTGYEKKYQCSLRIQLLYGSSKKLFRRETNYWKKRKMEFEHFLNGQQKCYDVYIGTVYKTLKSFFNYLKKEKGLPIGDFHKVFKMPLYTYRPVVIDTVQLQRFIKDDVFRNSLPVHLASSFDVFVVGCITGLRYHDLIHLKKTNIVERENMHFLQTTTNKTATDVNIPLPGFIKTILQRTVRKNSVYLFKQISNGNFNTHLKRIMELAGYTQPYPKMRYKKGILVEMKTVEGKSFRFCDHISAHTMRRTAITTLLVMGVPEMVVRKISGHAPGSKEFYRYISLAQDYTNKHLIWAYEKLLDFVNE